MQNFKPGICLPEAAADLQAACEHFLTIYCSDRLAWSDKFLFDSAACQARDAVRKAKADPAWQPPNYTLPETAPTDA